MPLRASGWRRSLARPRTASVLRSGARPHRASSNARATQCARAACMWPPESFPAHRSRDHHRAGGGCGDLAASLTPRPAGRRVAIPSRSPASSSQCERPGSTAVAREVQEETAVRVRTVNPYHSLAAVAVPVASLMSRLSCRRPDSSFSRCRSPTSSNTRAGSRGKS